MDTPSKQLSTTIQVRLYYFLKLLVDRQGITDSKQSVAQYKSEAKIILEQIEKEYSE